MAKTADPLDRVKTMAPLDRLLYWIQEREDIRLRKEAGEPPPWTRDPILMGYRFCNVRRMDDKVSRWLLEHWYDPHRDHPRMLLAAATARFFNLPSTLGAITELVFRPDGRWDGGAVIRKVRALRKAGATVFNGAYMVRGNDGPDKAASVMTHNVAMLARARVAVDPTSMEKTWGRIVEVRGFGSFMAGQVVADLRWAVSGSWADKDSWAPAGPGSTRGLNRLLDQPLKSTFSQEDFRAKLTELIDECRRLLPAAVTCRLEAMDYQNCLCEYDGYERTLWGQGRKKERYDPSRPKYKGLD